MNTLIMQWASSAMYQNQLVAHSSVAKHLLCQLNGVSRNEDTGKMKAQYYFSLGDRAP